MHSIVSTSLAKFYYARSCFFVFVDPTYDSAFSAISYNLSRIWNKKVIRQSSYSFTALSKSISTFCRVNLVALKRSRTLCHITVITGCSHAIFTVRSVINHYTAHGSTVNLCAVDISKAFDRMNHFGLFCTLMDRLIPVNILQMLEDWFAKCFTCVKWGSVSSCFFQLTRGIRQGGVYRHICLRYMWTM